MNVAVEKPASGPHPANLAQSKPFYSLEGWTLVIKGLLFVGVGLCVVSIGLMIGIFQSANALNGPNVAGIKEMAAGMMLVSLGQLLTGAIAGLALLAWIYKAYSNLPALDAGSLRFAPVVALLLCLVPVINIVVTLFLLIEIWRESDPARLDPAGHHRSSDGVVYAWFAVTLLVLCGAGYSFLTNMQRTEPQDLFEATLVGIGVTSLAIVQSILLIWIVGAVCVNQIVRRNLALNPVKPPVVKRMPEFPGTGPGLGVR